MNNKVYYLAEIPDIVHHTPRLGNVEKVFHDPDFDEDIFTIVVADGTRIGGLRESDLFFLERQIEDEISRLLYSRDFPQGLPGDWTEYYFQILKAIELKERESASSNQNS